MDLKLLLISGVLFSAIFSPYLYSCITWNYSLAIFSATFMSTIFVVYVVLLSIYLCLPGETIDYLFEKSVSIFKSAFSGSIQKTEENIRETFKIEVLHRSFITVIESAILRINKRRESFIPSFSGFQLSRI